jgi:CHAD domain-containing protein
VSKRVGEEALRAVGAARREFLTRAHRAIGERRDDELHAARIAAKRLRYTIEFYASALGPTRSTALGLLALLQDRLGEIADDEAFERFYAGLEEKLARDDPRQIGIQSLSSACDAHRREAIEAVHILWNGGEYPPYPDMLGASISAALDSPSSNGA